MVKGKMTQEIIDDLKIYYAYPPHHVITNMMREDPYYKISLLEKHKANTLQELEDRVEFIKYHMKRQREIDSWK